MNVVSVLGQVLVQLHAGHVEQIEQQLQQEVVMLLNVLHQQDIISVDQLRQLVHLIQQQLHQESLLWVAQGSSRHKPHEYQPPTQCLVVQVIGTEENYSRPTPAITSERRAHSPVGAFH